MARVPFDPELVRRPAENATPQRTLLSVSQVTALVKRAVESTLPSTVHVVGELSNSKRHTSGHWYFTLKDGSSELSCVMWRSAVEGQKFAPRDGLEVVASGTVEVFERAGRYQLYVRRLEPRGVGALELAFRQLCEKLAREGLFDAARKRSLPKFPRRIVVVTSPTGAAIADIARTIRRRFPAIEILLYPVRVQGSGAAEEIAEAIRRVNINQAALGGVDVLIVGRGGGSLEDLWAFNEEVVARAIFASEIPIVSAVGHEVDVTIADLVADVRAATPTAAGELAVPSLDEVTARIAAARWRIERAARSLAELRSAQLRAIEHRRALREPLHIVRKRELAVDECCDRLAGTLQRRLARLRRVLDFREPTVRRIAPHRYLLVMLERLRHSEGRLRREIHTRLDGARGQGERARYVLERASPRHHIAEMGERIRGLESTFPAWMDHFLKMREVRLAVQEKRLIAVDPQSVLTRGYSITRTASGRRLVRSVADVDDGERLVTRVADGEFESEVVNLRQLELFR